jgi:hypothetical protein
VAIAHGLFPNARIVAGNASDADAPFESTAFRDLTSTFIAGPNSPADGLDAIPRDARLHRASSAQGEHRDTAHGTQIESN